ncbi:MAG: sigma-70 family RNA polymerase sigma factor [Bacteroidetes bacterium]|nr:sigma-70 family RNA polymerase sigma factor [Fibrella sp.]
MKLPLKDEELIHLYLNTQEGNYFEHLYNRYVSKVYQRCLSFTRDAVQAQDFTQDIFVRVLTKLDRFQERSSFSTWLYAISYNYCMDQLRTVKRLDTVSLDENYAQTVIDAEPAVSIEYQLQQLASVMDKIAPSEVRLLGLRYEQGLPIDEIARQLHLKDSAVKMRLKRTREKLRRLYEQAYPAEAC